jgi:hypothetical protein
MREYAANPDSAGTGFAAKRDDFSSNHHHVFFIA